MSEYEFNADEWAESFKDMLGIDPHLIVRKHKPLPGRDSNALRRLRLIRRARRLGVTLQASSLKTPSALSITEKGLGASLESGFYPSTWRVAK